MRLLIAEDDRALSSFLRRGLGEDGDQVELAYDGQVAIELFLSHEPDLLILDLELPGCCGTEVLAVVRQVSPLCPVLVLSGRAEAETRVACLNLGADDCMMKPFSLAELRARCRGMLRRRQATRDLLDEMSARKSAFAAPAEASEARADLDSCTLRMGSLRMQRLEARVDVAGAPLHLTNREFRLLEQLLLATGAPVSRSALRQAVWGGREVETNVLDVHMVALRRKLCSGSGAPGVKAAPGMNSVPVIETVRGAGFRLCWAESMAGNAAAVLPTALDGSFYAATRA